MRTFRPWVRMSISVRGAEFRSAGLTLKLLSGSQWQNVTWRVLIDELDDDECGPLDPAILRGDESGSPRDALLPNGRAASLRDACRPRAIAVEDHGHMAQGSMRWCFALGRRDVAALCVRWRTPPAICFSASARRLDQHVRVSDRAHPQRCSAREHTAASLRKSLALISREPSNSHLGAEPPC